TTEPCASFPERSVASSPRESRCRQARTAPFAAAVRRARWRNPPSEGVQCSGTAGRWFVREGTARSAKRPIATAMITAFALVPLDAAAVKVVNNCDDHGAGSLRQAILDAGEGELVDATKLAPCTISLTTGMLVVANNDLRIDGPGRGKLTIDAL